MSVKKFKSFEEASKDLWNYSPDQEFYKRMIKFYKLAANFSNTAILHGIYKFRTIEDANLERENSRSNRK